MLNVNESMTSAGAFNEIKETVYEKLGKVFDNQSMVKEVANQILLSSLQDSNSDILKDKLDVKIKTTSNKYRLKGQKLVAILLEFHQSF
ncbi:MAG: hypothetical protein P9M05_06420 [Candidatus Stygibacter australis]|nr:hypothetical protein [Candidatus Stygibacter australis]